MRSRRDSGEDPAFRKGKGRGGPGPFRRRGFGSSGSRAGGDDPKMKRLRAVLFPMAILFVCGCAAPDKPVVPPVDIADGFTRSGGTPLPDQWWRSFDDPILDRLIEEALSGNFDLKTAWDRLRQARATARVEAAALIPAAEGRAGVTRSRRVESAGEDFDFADTTNRAGTTIETNYSLGLEASYELDLWGRVRSARDAAAFDAKASAEEVQTAALTLSASVADTWYQLVEQNAQIDLLEAQLDLNAKVTKLVTTRFKQGQVGSLDVFQQRQLEESRRGDLALAAAQAAILRHRLAILLGQPTGGFPRQWRTDFRASVSRRAWTPTPNRYGISLTIISPRWRQISSRP